MVIYCLIILGHKCISSCYTWKTTKENYSKELWNYVPKIDIVLLGDMTRTNYDYINSNDVTLIHIMVTLL